MSKIVQVISHPDTGVSQGALMCLCEDGTLWDYSIRNCKPGEGVHRWHSMATPDSEEVERKATQAKP